MVICDILAKNDNCTTYNRPNAEQMRRTHWADFIFTRSKPVLDQSFNRQNDWFTKI